MSKLFTLALVLAAGSSAACKKKDADKAEKKDTTGSAGMAAPATDAAAAVATPDAPAAWDAKTPLSLTEGFSTPESVLYDADADVYLVSNINGKPLDADDNGFISKVSPEGKVLEPKWIDGAKDNIKLDAPKGSAIAGGILYVSDINVVRKFDAKTGEPKGEVKIEGATFLNDVAVAPGGGVYVTDSGLTPEFKPTGTDAIYHVAADDKVHKIAKDKGLSGPNGVLAGDKDAVWAATFTSGELYSVDAKGKKANAQKLPKGQLDGIVKLDGGELLVSSWEGSAIYRGKPGGEWKAVVENVQSPADIGYDTKRHRILIPVFMGNTVIIHPLNP
jgi:sugar lactone lactonase YvrE